MFRRAIHAPENIEVVFLPHNIKKLCEISQNKVFKTV